MPQYHHNQLHNVVNPDYYQVYYIDIAASTSKYIGMTTAAGIKDVQGFLRMYSKNTILRHDSNIISYSFFSNRHTTIREQLASIEFDYTNRTKFGSSWL